jgi:hypothetical protein
MSDEFVTGPSVRGETPARACPCGNLKFEGEPRRNQNTAKRTKNEKEHHKEFAIAPHNVLWLVGKVAKPVTHCTATRKHVEEPGRYRRKILQSV